MFEYHKMWLWDMLAARRDDAIRAQIKYGRFRFAVLSFMRSLDINIKEGYLCPKCGPSPDVVVFDGMTLSIRKQLQLNKRPQECATQQYDGSKLTSRVFFNNAEGRKLLAKFDDFGLEESAVKCTLYIVCWTWPGHTNQHFSRCCNTA